MNILSVITTPPVVVRALLAQSLLRLGHTFIDIPRKHDVN